jgi:regulatory protein
MWSKKPRKAKAAPKITEEYLREEAYTYLARYSASGDRVRTVLMRRVTRSNNYHGGHHWAEYKLQVNRVIAELIDQGLLNDEHFASLEAQYHHKKGYSKLAIRRKLMNSQFKYSAIDIALKGIQSDRAGSEIQRACAYVRRRRIGLFRSPLMGESKELAKQRSKMKKRDYDALIRAGFPFAIVGRVMSCKTLEEFRELEEEVRVNLSQ